MRSVNPIIGSVLILFAFTAPLFCEEKNPGMEDLLFQMQEQMQAMQQQILELQAQNRLLEERLNGQSHTSEMQAQKTVTVEPPPQEQMPTEQKPTEKILTEQKPTEQMPTEQMPEQKFLDGKPPQSPNPISSKYGIDIYGYIKLDAAYDDSRIVPGNYAFWAASDSRGGDDDEFNLTANQSRIGAILAGPEVGGALTGGRIEVDFYGNGGWENKPNLCMRHAYLEMNWPHHEFGVLAGQTWDVISPLNPNTINFLVNSNAGNIGYRRPQLRLTKGFTFQDQSQILLQGALSRTIGEEFPTGPGDTGEDNSFPTVQGRAAYSFDALTSKPSVVGFSGHYGREEYDFDLLNTRCYHDTYSINLDLTIPLFEKLILQSELWMGENLDTYLGAIMQGINYATLDEIRSVGGWLALGLGPWGQWSFNLGASIDDPYDADLRPGDRSENSSYFVNTFYQMNQAIQLGLEFSYWMTDYIDLDNGDALRTQASIIYKF